MEQQGYLTRRRCTGGVGRATNATLTNAGLAKITAAAPGHVRAVRDLLFDALTSRDIEALATIGRRVRPRLNPQDTLPQVRSLRWKLSGRLQAPAGAAAAQPLPEEAERT